MHLWSGVSGFPRRLSRVAALTAALMGAGALLASFGGAGEIVNPHDTATPKFCLNCHTEEVYSKICNESESYCLLGGSVDGICLTCHIKEDCCTPALRHLPKLHLGKLSHRSDIDASRIPEAYYPRTLPLHRGRITCNTCHLHTKAQTGGYKMLRLVKISGQSVDWAVLCQDCHKDR